MSVNKVILLGRLGADPEVKMIQSGQQVATFSLALSETWMKDGKKEEKTEWARCVAWGKTAELAGKYLKKGKEVFVEGKLQTRSWDDNNGVKRYVTEIVVREITFVSGTKSDSGSNPTAPNPSSPSYAPDEDSDVPF